MTFQLKLHTLTSGDAFIALRQLHFSTSSQLSSFEVTTRSPWLNGMFEDDAADFCRKQRFIAV